MLTFKCFLSYFVLFVLIENISAKPGIVSDYLQTHPKLDPLGIFQKPDTNSASAKATTFTTNLNLGPIGFSSTITKSDAKATSNGNGVAIADAAAGSSNNGLGHGSGSSSAQASAQSSNGFIPAEPAPILPSLLTAPMTGEDHRQNRIYRTPTHPHPYPNNPFLNGEIIIPGVSQNSELPSYVDPNNPYLGGNAPNRPINPDNPYIHFGPHGNQNPSGFNQNRPEHIPIPLPGNQPSEGSTLVQIPNIPSRPGGHGNSNSGFNPGGHGSSYGGHASPNNGFRPSGNPNSGFNPGGQGSINSNYNPSGQGNINSNFNPSGQGNQGFNRPPVKSDLVDMHEPHYNNYDNNRNEYKETLDMIFANERNQKGQAGGSAFDVSEYLRIKGDEKASESSATASSNVDTSTGLIFSNK